MIPHVGLYKKYGEEGGREPPPLPPFSPAAVYHWEATPFDLTHPHDPINHPPLATLPSTATSIATIASAFARSLDPPRAAWWPFWRGDNDNNADGGGSNGNGGRGSATTREAEAMRHTTKMMEEHRQSQEVSKRATAMMDKLLSTLIVGRSAAGLGRGEDTGHHGGRRRKEGPGQGDLQRPPAFGGIGRGLKVPVLVVV